MCYLLYLIVCLCSARFPEKSSQILIWQIHSLAIFVIQEDGRIQFDTITLGVTPISDHYCSTEQSQRQSYIISNQLRRVTTELPPGSWTSSGHLTVQGLFKNCKGCVFFWLKMAIGWFAILRLEVLKIGNVLFQSSQYNQQMDTVRCKGVRKNGSSFAVQGQGVNIKHGQLRFHQIEFLKL